MSEQGTTVLVAVETWRNPGQSRVVIRRADRRTGDMTGEEMVNGGKTFTITPLERELNQRMAYSPELDLFSNGTLTPIDLIEGSDAAREFARNPNLLSDGDMQRLVTPARGKAKEASDAAFAEKLASINNPTTVARLLQLAEEEDAPISRVRAIQARLSELEGLGMQRTSVDGGSPASPDAPRGQQLRPGAPRPTTPR